MAFPRLHARFHPEIAVKFLLFPYLLAQGAWLRKAALVLPEPEGARAGIAGSGPPLRLLLLGDSSAAGVGVSQQSEALSGQLLGHLGPHFTVDWVLDAKTGRTTQQMFKRLVKMPTAQYDIAVTALGVNDITRRASRENWLEDTELMWDLLQSKFGVRQIYVSGVPDIGQFPLLPSVLRWILGRQATRYDAGLREMAARREGCVHVPADLSLHGLMAEDGFHPGPEVYAAWAERLAAHIQPEYAALLAASEKTERNQT